MEDASAEERTDSGIADVFLEVAVPVATVTDIAVGTGMVVGRGGDGGGMAHTSSADNFFSGIVRPLLDLDPHVGDECILEDTVSQQLATIVTVMHSNPFSFPFPLPPLPPGTQTYECGVYFCEG